MMNAITRSITQYTLSALLLGTAIALMAGDGASPTDAVAPTAAAAVANTTTTATTATTASVAPSAPSDTALIPAVIRVAPLGGRQPGLKSTSALVLDQNEGVAVYEKNSQRVTPIASITKLMTAMVVLDADLPLDETLIIRKEDKDYLRGTRSRLSVGLGLSRYDMLHLALMSSENRAAAALARNYPGGKPAFVEAMNRKAQQLGMRDTRFVDSTGLSGENVSTAQDLSKMVLAAYQYVLIRKFTTASSYDVKPTRGRALHFHNSDRLVRNANWQIGLSKTGYISEAGRCLVLQAKIAEHPVVIVLLDSWGKNTRIGDANRLRKWLERQMVRRDDSRDDGKAAAKNTAAAGADE